MTHQDNNRARPGKMHGRTASFYCDETDMREPLKRDEMCRHIERGGAARRIPMLFGKWLSAQRFEQKGQADRVRRLVEEYPMDAQLISWCNIKVHEAPADDPSFRWMHVDAPEDDGVTRGIDSYAPLSDWAMLDDVLADFPDPDYPGLWPNVPEPDGRYRFAHWWYGLFERHWSLRSMEGALMDYVLHPEETHRLFDRLCSFYCRMIERADEELDADGIYFTDDLGTQAAPFFSVSVFDEFYAPYYHRMVQTAHDRGMHVMMHSCGDITRFLPRLIELGMDMIHPIQKYAMDETEVARRFGGQVSFVAGFDVQRIIPYGSPDEVRAEVRHLIDTYARPGGGLLMASGNAITEDAPVDSVEALLDETWQYGRKAMKGGGV